MKEYRVKPGSQFKLDRCDPDDSGDYKKTDQGKEKAKAITVQLIGRLEELQELLYANGTRSLLIVLQGMDTCGKDGTIRSVMSGVNPQGCKVVSFKTSSSEELGHDFLWRVHQKAPSKGQIGIFNRSHYEDVLITRVHGWVSNKVVQQRFNQIKEFEELLHESGTTILKFFRTSRRMNRKNGWRNAFATWRSAGNSTKRISKNGNCGKSTRPHSRPYLLPRAPIMRPGISCPPIESGIAISWSPSVSSVPWKT